jgi:hypothetical protein
MEDMENQIVPIGTKEVGVVILRLVDETCGMFAGGESMADELQRERRADLAEQDIRVEFLPLKAKV